MPLTDAQAMVLISAGVLSGRAVEVLSDFEAGAVREVCQRFVDHKRDAVVTDAEWPVLNAAVEAMRAEVNRRIQAAEAKAA